MYKQEDQLDIAEGPHDAPCQLKPCEMSHNVHQVAFENLAQANDLQGHPKSLEMARIDRPYDATY